MQMVVASWSSIHNLQCPQLILAALVGLVLISSLLRLILFKTHAAATAGCDSGFPPGPRSWPIIGHLPLLRGSGPHQTLADLSLKHGYGPILGLRLGSRPAVVISSASLARELLLTHDKTFANRPRFLFSDTIFYGYDTAVVFSSYNPHWVQLRKIYTMELFTAKRLHELEFIRQEEMRGLLHDLLQASSNGTKAVDVGRIVANMTSNTTARLVYSKKMAGGATKLPELIRELEHETVPTIGDFIPWLKLLDIRQRNSMKHLHDRLDKFIDSIVSERRQAMKSCSAGQELPRDFLQVLLSKESSSIEEERVTNLEIKAIMLDIFAAGVQTSAVTLEWAMAELVQNRQCLCKLFEEIEAVMGGNDDLVRDEDVSKLPYLENIVKEVLRLHPVVPLLVPRISSQACKIGKYTLPERTLAFVNVYGIGRDPGTWEDPNSFWPERFELGKDKYMQDMRGMHYDLLPFGSGRRMCPGMRLGLSIVQVTLANLVKTFDWELPPTGVVDMTEKGGISTSKATPLLAIPKPR